MKGGIRIDVAGLDEAVRRVRSLTSALEAKEVEKVLLQGVKPVQREAKLRVPVKTGQLKSAIKARIGKRRGRMVAGAFSAVDFKKAPHAYLVEYGHDLVRGGKKSKGGHVVKHVAARPYFRPAWDMTQNEVRKTIEDGLRDLLEGALR